MLLFEVKDEYEKLHEMLTDRSQLLAESFELLMLKLRLYVLVKLVLGSIRRILPCRQKDFTFPSYRKFRSKEAGFYLPDPAYDITIDKIVHVDFLSSS
ncbi:hypothetical protein AgCh_031362 [Apium graveolens]